MISKRIRINKRKFFVGCIILTVLLIAGAFFLWQRPFWYNQATKNTDYNPDNSTQFEIEPLISSTDAYEIETPDSNIDFRRVGNLNVYFSRHAQSLTTDLNDIKSWQGGDIVVFGTHVAIVSDKRNSKGIPYILHLVSPTQKAYEQDGMEHWEKKAGIMGHYRMGQ